MNRGTIAAVILTAAMVFGGCTADRYAYRGRGREMKPDTLAMKKSDVISLSKAGVSDSLIITMLTASDSWFQLKPQDVIDLKNAGVSDRVISAMVEMNAPPPQGDGSSESAYYSYSPYYWYPGYYPYWYYPSLYFGFGYRYYHSPYYVHRVAPHGYYYGGRSGVRNSGRHR
ncbi:MAG TPA: hypothetical protein VMM58_12175 [Bacteroidota bacterium]|nr:hypothetical protein [Bacteroidota bacterium]